MPIRLVVADDHPIVLAGLERLFGFEPDFEIACTCISGAEALQAVRRHVPDVLVLDVRMPGNEDLAVLRALQADGLPTRVVLLTVGLSAATLREASQLGAACVVLKEAAPEHLIACIRKVHGGQTCMGMAANSTLGEPSAAPSRESAGAGSEPLTLREIEIVRMAARGLRNREIAARLAISEGTVKVHLHNIYLKLEVDGRVALVLAAERRGLA